MRMLCAMSADKAKEPRQTGRKPAVNLTLDQDAIKKGNALAQAWNRPSLSNVVEHLIMEAARAEGLEKTEEAA